MLVGVAVHVAAAGFDHAPGGRSAPVFLGGVGLALALALASAFIAGVLGRSYFPIATGGGRAYRILALALAGFAVYLGVEAFEGDVDLAECLRAAAAALPAAALVLGLAGRAARVASRAGSRFAAACKHVRREPEPSRVHAEERPAFALRRRARSPKRGRAPPLFA
jgi:hypothetical protein